MPAGQPGAFGPALATTRPSRPTMARPSDRSSAAIRSSSRCRASSSWRATASTPNDRCSWYDSSTVFRVGLLEIRLARRSASRCRSRCEAASCRCAAARSPAMPRSTTARVSRTRTAEIAASTPTTVAKAIATTRTTKRGAGAGAPHGGTRLRRNHVRKGHAIRQSAAIAAPASRTCRRMHAAAGAAVAARRGLAARGERPAAFDGRIHPGC